ncbi:MAG: N-6 DNA methylase, partial [Planctomycetes bacterium]|nr:N-6 DNA methylase [Planctomycetota bacterium]
MLLRKKSAFASVRTEGGLLPPDLLVRIANGDAKLAATSTADYHLTDAETKREAISRSWSRLVSAWETFQDALAKLPASDPGTTTTREKWLAVVFHELGFGRLEKRTAVEIDGKSYAISHGWRTVPIHLVGANVPIDRRSEHVVGASRTSPHGLVQEFLNRRGDALWGIVSNGRTFRLLRDSVRLTRPAYVDFDLSAMFEGGSFPDFALFWLVCHQSRFEPFQSERIEDCPLERWSKTADDEGTRVLERLRDGVRTAIEDLGRGFLAHAANDRLRSALREGRLSPQDYYRQLLRVAYRLIFQAVAEDRRLLLDPNADAAARARYDRWYSLARVRRLAEKRRGSRHDDLWRMVKVVWRLLGNDRGGPALALPALGSFLWSDAAAPDVVSSELTNEAFLDAIHHLAFAVEGNVRRAVDFEHLGAEELGSVYESLLELHPELHLDDARFDLKEAAGNDRKSTGSYYTPDSLVQCLLDSALEPVLDDVARANDPRPLADRLLAVKVCDPACGSGHFLIAAAHRLAKRVAQARTGDDEPAPDDRRRALRDVIGRCLFGVDKNEMAVELCKVSLWLESLTSGQPLSFLDDRILVGDALLGATPALLREPLPPEAFDPIGDDDKALVRELKRKNKDE